MARAGARISKDPEVRREEFLTAALHLFSSLGYEKTSVQMITDAVGVAKGLFYHYFASKADLLNQLAGWQAEVFIATLPQHAEEMQGNSLEKLHEISRRALQWKFEDVRQLTRAYLEVMYREENRALRSALLSEYTARLIPLFTEIIAEAVEEGFCDVENPELAAELMFALGSGISDRVAELILGLPDHPQNLERLVARLRAWEGGVERLLGMRPGTLELYDYAYVEHVLRTLLEEE